MHAPDNPDNNDGPIRDELQRVLSSPRFAQNVRLSKFLGLIVERELQGKRPELKESLLGVEVFDREPGFNPRQDSIVRTQPPKLREALARYYAQEGAPDPSDIRLPKHACRPLFRKPEPMRHGGA